MELLKRLMTEEEGQGIVEYALIVALVVFIIWVAVKASGIGNKVSDVFVAVGNTLDSASQ
ncbi:MAG: pilin protein [Deltaproteobacteria bacterium]|nr:pilin protein [Deltaproteobacteria bacterium]